MVKNLPLPKNLPIRNHSKQTFTNPAKLIIEKCKYYLSIALLKNKITIISNPKFSLRLSVS